MNNRDSSSSASDFILVLTFDLTTSYAVDFHADATLRTTRGEIRKDFQSGPARCSEVH